ncbi:phage protein [Neorhizobium sp. LjRoot104]|uniref:phage protein n=1 Tax=Neorhizobium sp. LjRoot104 TaxID=3342254 RepID=UPI003ED12ACA
MDQYLRKVRATFNGGFIVNPGSSTLDQIRIEFSISKGISSAQNTADITIFNLEESHRNSIGKEFDNITLEAGYIPPGGDGNVGIIFKGAVRDVEHRREGPNILTTISCGDGDRALRRATISKSFPAGTPVKDVVEEVYKQMEKEGVSRGEWKFPEDMQPTFKRPYAVCGSCTRELDTIGRGKGFYWSSQNETIEIVPGNGFVGSVALITPETGMIGTPAITDNGVRVSALLNPEIRPNRRVQVKSQTLEMNAADGMYRVSEVNFSGNNMDGEFKVDVSGEAIQSGKVDEGKK